MTTIDRVNLHLNRQAAMLDDVRERAQRLFARSSPQEARTDCLCELYRQETRAALWDALLKLLNAGYDLHEAMGKVQERFLEDLNHDPRGLHHRDLTVALTQLQRNAVGVWANNAGRALR